MIIAIISYMVHNFVMVVLCTFTMDFCIKKTQMIILCYHLSLFNDCFYFINHKSVII